MSPLPSSSRSLKSVQESLALKSSDWNMARTSSSSKKVLGFFTQLWFLPIHTLWTRLCREVPGDSFGSSRKISVAFVAVWSFTLKKQFWIIYHCWPAVGWEPPQSLAHDNWGRGDKFLNTCPFTYTTNKWFLQFVLLYEKRLQRKSSENQQNDENAKYVFSLGPENTESGMSTCAIKNQDAPEHQNVKLVAIKDQIGNTVSYLSQHPTNPKKLKISCFVDHQNKPTAGKDNENNNSSELQL